MEASEKRYKYDVSNLPLDILSDILTRLSVNTLLKFKCVCKTWFCLISSSQFSKSHLNFSRNSKTYANHSVILTKKKRIHYTKYTCTLSSMLDGTSSTVNRLYHSIEGHGYISGNCNGLLLYAHHILNYYNPVLLNPVTRKFRSLPNSGRIIVKGCLHFGTHGLCYVASDDDYRIVVLGYFKDRNNKKYKFVDEVRIYSLRTNSWTKINDDFHCSGFVRTLNNDDGDDVSLKPGLPVGGSLHWAVCSFQKWCVGSSCQIFIVDTVTYTHGILAGPKIGVGCSRWGVMDFGGYLGVYHEFHKARFDLWAMKGSWTKVLSVPLPSYCVTPCPWPRPRYLPVLGILRDGEILVKDKSGAEVYNSREHSFIIKQVTCNLDAALAALMPSPVYIESLVAPGFDEENLLDPFSTNSTN